MNRLKKFSNNNYLFSVFTKIYLMLTGIVISSLQAKFLGKTFNGELAYVKDMSTILNTVFVLGMHQAYAYYKKKENENFKNRYLGAMILVFSFYLLSCLLIVANVSMSFELRAVIITIPILFFIKIIRYITLIEFPKSKNQVELISGTAKLLFCFVLLWFVEASEIWILWLLLFDELLCLILYLIKLRIKPKIDRTCFILLKKMISFGFFSMLNLLLNSLNYKVDVLMLKRRTLYEQIAVYSVGVTLAEGCWLVPDAIRDILLSKVVNGKTKNEVTMVIRFANTVILGMQLGLIVFGKFIIYFLYGSDYSDSYTILTLALVGSYGMNYTKMIGAFYVVEGRNKTNFWSMLVTAAINIVFNLCLIPVWGIYGAVFASIISYNVSGIIMLAHFKMKYNVNIKDVLFVKRQDIVKVKDLVRK